MVKVSRKKLAEMVKRALKEETAVSYSDLLPGVGGELDKFVEEVDAFLKETSSKSDELAKKADEMMRADVLSSPRVGERNRALLSRAGIMRRLRGNVVNMLEFLIREG